MSKRNVAFHMVLQLLWVLPVGLCYGQTNDLDARLSKPVDDYALTADSLAEALLQVANQFQIPMGIDWIDSPATRTRFTVNRTHATVKEILHAIVETKPGYEVTVSNGVVHVIATTVPPNQNFLLLPVRSFEVRHELVEMAQQELRDMVKATVVPSKPDVGGVAGSLTSNVGEPRIDLRVADVTVEDVLDALAVASTRKIWVVTFIDSATLTATGFRRTASLQDSSPAPDAEQPVWQTFSWRGLAQPSGDHD